MKMKKGHTKYNDNAKCQIPNYNIILKIGLQPQNVIFTEINFSKNN